MPPPGGRQQDGPGGQPLGGPQASRTGGACAPKPGGSLDQISQLQFSETPSSEIKGLPVGHPWSPGCHAHTSGCAHRCLDKAWVLSALPGSPGACLGVPTSSSGPFPLYLGCRASLGPGKAQTFQMFPGASFLGSVHSHSETHGCSLPWGAPAAPAWSGPLAPGRQV